MHNKITDAQAIMFDGVALPQGTGVGSDLDTLSTAVVVGGVCDIRLHAKTAIAVDTASIFYIELLKLNASDAYASPSSSAAARVYLVNKTATEGAIAVAAGGEIIPPIRLNEEWIGSTIKLNVYTNEDLSAQTIDAFLSPAP